MAGKVFRKFSVYTNMEQTSYKSTLLSRDEKQLAAEKQWLHRYEPLDTIEYPQYQQEPGVAYPKAKTPQRELYIMFMRTPYHL